MLNHPATWHLNEGVHPRRMRHSAHPSPVPFGNFETADDVPHYRPVQHPVAALGRDPGRGCVAGHAGPLVTRLVV